METKLRGWKSNKTKLLKASGYKSIRGVAKNFYFSFFVKYLSVITHGSPIKSGYFISAGVIWDNGFKDING